MTRRHTVNSSQGLVLYYMTRARDEQIARESLSPAALAGREAMMIRRARRRQRRWWSR